MLKTAILNLFNKLAHSGTIETLGHPQAGLIGWLGGPNTISDVVVTDSTALTFSAVWCATRIISETLASLPCVLYRRQPDGSREHASDDDRYWIVMDEPNPSMAASSFFEALTGQMVLTGNCYARLVYDGQGNLVRLDPFRPESVTPKLSGGDLEYRISGGGEIIPASDMLHVMGLSGDGLIGYSVIAKARESLGAAIAAEQMAAGQFGNGSMPHGALVVPMRLEKDKREHLRREWEELHRGPSKGGKVAVLHAGMDFKPISVSNEDAQFLQSREFSIRDVARWFRVPPHMLADMKDSSVRANIEQQAIEFIVYSMRPWLNRWERELRRKLLTREERKTMYFEFALDSLLRGDIASRYAAYSVARQWGWLSVNEIRKTENLDAVPGGDDYLQPANMKSVDDRTTTP